MATETTIYSGAHDDIRALLLGRRVARVDEHTLRLDDGTTLELPDTDGGCACSAGCYDLRVLNGVDNVITSVEFLDDPTGDDYPDEATGTYSIFVFAGEQRINLATWEGSDGNGYYGTGYRIEVRRPKEAEQHA